MIFLLRDHLLSYRLVEGLERTGLDAIAFNLHLSDTIFTLMGFGSREEDEKLFEDFLKWSEKVLDIEFSLTNREPLDELSMDIYKKLKAEQRLLKPKK